jgi:hypothetical protein
LEDENHDSDLVMVRFFENSEYCMSVDNGWSPPK